MLSPSNFGCFCFAVLTSLCLMLLILVKKMQVILTILPDPLNQEPLLVENIPDPLAGEQVNSIIYLNTLYLCRNIFSKFDFRLRKKFCCNSFSVKWYWHFYFPFFPVYLYTGRYMSLREVHANHYCIIFSVLTLSALIHIRYIC